MADSASEQVTTPEVYQGLETAWLCWRAGALAPRWQEHLPGPGQACCPDALLHLLLVDVEFRAKAGLPGLLQERYFEHPRLQQPDARLGPAQRVELIAWEYQQRWQFGRRSCRADYVALVPEQEIALRELRVWWQCPACGKGAVPLDDDRAEQVRCLGCQRLVAVAELFPARAWQGAPADGRGPGNSEGSGAEAREAEPAPSQIGRYRVVRLLGRGGFGLVYLAHDEQLGRPVAIKVPHARLVAQAAQAEAYRTEARTVANLDHPNIVPVYDVGSTEPFPFYVVSKYIDGMDLAARLQESRLSRNETVELLATVAEALHHAHKQGLVHRDVKPGNILLDRSGKPFVADFGLALREQDVGKGPRFAGTPAYMSPEQARGEGHRVDGRSDIFSLGVVFYELLTGRRPFKADSREELLEQITSVEARPPRQGDDRIPRELERICLKALSKRASERYSTARDMADDLRHFLAGAPAEEQSTLPGREKHEAGATTPQPSPMATPASDRGPIRMVPKGLRSFDAQDADFFLELLPGPRDREGLPDSLRFWKARIEETDPDNTFGVGLIYGPSGCGKSSLVKAGLLPRLADDVLAVYVEATVEDTETRLLNGLRKRCPALAAHLGLKETLTALRQGQGIPSGKKVLMVLDQFEQWLHARREEENTELVQALRQCDGGRVQCVVLVRDDFWMAATRFMRELEIRLAEGQNSAAVDLFPLRHAEKVLAAFGRAFGALPEVEGSRHPLVSSKLTDPTLQSRVSQATAAGKDHKQFVEQAVRDLAQEGKVICVRLALFAEMVKGKPWTPATLKEVGGTEGVGVTFLEETFAASTAPPQHRLHQQAARAVLKALLPKSGSDIKGNMRSSDQLLQASGYARRPRDFEELLRILDGEVRLITPTEPPAADAEGSGGQALSGEKYYQLTHDYLVHSLRAWLTRKQKETRRGRAELLLASRADAWSARPEARQLPSLPQWLRIRLLTNRKDWTGPQRQMMRSAFRHHLRRGLVLGAVLALLAGVGVEGYGRLKAHALQDRLHDATTTEVPAIVAAMAPYRHWIDPLLRQSLKQAAANGEARSELHASLALLPVDPGQKDYLCGRLLDAEPQEIPILRDALLPHKQELLDRLWAAAAHPPPHREGQRLRAACALATYDPDSPRWADVAGPTAGDLVAVPAVTVAAWMDGLRPVRGKLRPPLAAVFRNVRRPPTERSLAADILADYAADRPDVLADLLVDADDKQFAVLYPRLGAYGDRATGWLEAVLDRRPPPGPGADVTEKFARRQASAAAALVKLGRPGKVWPLLRDGPDPRVRCYLMHRLGAVGVAAGAVVKRLREEPDVAARRALVLSLGEFGRRELGPTERSRVVEDLQQAYRGDPDAGLHAATEWLLRRWQQDAWLGQTNARWAGDRRWREELLQAIGRDLKAEAKPRWYVNAQGQTMVVVPGPRVFWMGSPRTEPDREGGPEGKLELRHRQRIGRSFAIAAKEVTVKQFLRFRPAHKYNPQYAPTGDCPVNKVSWYDAAAYCNWLSAQDGIAKKQWCYLPNKEGKYAQGMTVVPGYLRRQGYRLPTEAEWECTCRAGTWTSRPCGETAELLEKYAWYTKNSRDRGMEPAGLLKPNDWGLCDMLGNALEWCQDLSADYVPGDGQASEDKEHPGEVLDNQYHMLRGGAFYYAAFNVRSANRNRNVTTTRTNYTGFRPARTVR